MSKEVRPRADHREKAHHQLFADRINRRIGHLRKVLLEIIVEQTRLVREHGNWCVRPHRANGIVRLDRHRLKELCHIFLSVTKGLLALEERCVRRRNLGQFRLNLADVGKLVLRLLEPLLVRVGRCEVRFELFVLNDAAFFKVDEEHLARLQTPFAGNVFLFKRQNAAF